MIHTYRTRCDTFRILKRQNRKRITAKELIWQQVQYPLNLEEIISKAALEAYRWIFGDYELILITMIGRFVTFYLLMQAFFPKGGGLGKERGEEHKLRYFYRGT